VAGWVDSQLGLGSVSTGSETASVASVACRYCATPWLEIKPGFKQILFQLRLCSFGTLPGRLLTTRFSGTVVILHTKVQDVAWNEPVAIAGREHDPE